MANILDIFKKSIKQKTQEQEGKLMEFDLDNVKIVKLDKQTAELLESQSHLESLSLVECSLKTLEGFPKLPNLQNLVLETNQLDGEAIKFIGNTYPKLLCLSLAENQIKTFADLEPIKQLKKLQQLDLSENPIAKLPGYFQKVFDLVPGLSVLDNKDKSGNDIQYSEDEDELVVDDSEDSENEIDDEDDGLDDDDDDEESSPKPTKKAKQ
ncbi:unnamed protein product (macronuclear) [Paramecium tetraurelia]|uniref:U2A'/phosphoprotein 32 family A C-terminal domain-containing protein n=1 Tax=Paramecium tetraurelia TaxID=5888 RepID=A0D3E7_PARTE|nr:uncharacterized protein GSPATT00013050001 [Paramecium tetraurelia]CAK77564.1 unnamed protein product [Paramecium tetraurelia]|eukprot:XP_001444961.1 hypothetical protein (macronuclear) [Paramecium tetraurelia strain d4-2]